MTKNYVKFVNQICKKNKIQWTHTKLNVIEEVLMY